MYTYSEDKWPPPRRRPASAWPRGRRGAPARARRAPLCLSVI